MNVRLVEEVEILKKNGQSLSQKLPERYRVTKEMKGHYATHKLCKAIHLTLSKCLTGAISVNRLREASRLVNSGSCAHGIDRGYPENSLFKR